MGFIFTPIIDTIFWWTVRTIHKMWDQSSCCYTRRKKTRSISPFQYLDVYGGAEYKIGRKYSTFMLMITISIIYCSAIPLLIPVTLIALVVAYILEKLKLAYYYKKPRYISENINIVILHALKIGICGFFLIAYWQFSIPMKFENVAVFNRSLDQYPIISNFKISFKVD